MVIKKVYESVIKSIKDNHNFLLFLIFLVIVLNIKVPYVISSPGGIMSVSDKVLINNKKVNNNFYTTYVKVYEGNVATYLVGKIMPRWDVTEESKYTGSSSLSYEELNQYEKLLLKQGNNIAIMLALKEANIEYSLDDIKLYVLYKLEGYENDLKIGDEIISCDNEKLSNFEGLKKCITSSNSGKVLLGIKRGKSEKEIIVPTYHRAGENIIGVNIFEDASINSGINIKIDIDDNESGSSGGFLTALSIYDAITDSKLSKGIKVSGTGTISEDGKIGKIGGVKYKLLGANKKGVDIFFVPKENYKEAMKIKKKYNLKLKIVKVSKFNEAVNYLLDLK